MGKTGLLKMTFPQATKMVFHVNVRLGHPQYRQDHAQIMNKNIQRFVTKIA